MHADDSKIYHKIKNIADCYQLQSDLAKLNAWSKEWLLSFNIMKYKYIRLGITMKLYLTTYAIIMFNDDKVTYILQTFEETGIMINPSMNLSEQILHKINQCRHWVDGQVG